MTVSTLINRVQYSTNGTTGPWTVPYYFLEDEHLSVVYTDGFGVDTTLTLTTDYTVTGAGVLSGGTVTTVAHYPSGGVLTILRVVPATQETDYTETDPFPAEALERALDKLTMLVQQAGYASGRAIMLPSTDVTNNILPDAATRAGKFLVFGPTGGVDVGEGGGGDGQLRLDLASTLDPTLGSALVALNTSSLHTGGSIGRAVQDMHGTRQFDLYVSTSGSDSNDGLTLLTPFATLQKAFDTIKVIGFVGGKRSIYIAAGTYSSTAARTSRLGPGNETEVTPNSDPYLQDGITQSNYLLITGPDVGYDPATNPWPTPTALFDGGAASVTGMQFEGKVNVLLKNVKFSNYSAGSAAGVSMDGGWLRTENVHTDNCAYGILGQQARLEVRGGDLYGSAGKTGTGVRSIFLTYHSLGNQSALGAGQGPRFRFLATGFQAQEGATGHADSCTFEDCTAGILATVNARVNYSYSDFKRCGRAIRAEYGAVIFGATTSNFNFLTANANIEAISIQSGASDVDRDAYSNGVYATNYLVNPITCTGTTTGTNWEILSKTLAIGRFAPTITPIRKPQHIEGQAFGRINAALLGDVQMKFRFASSLAKATITIDHTAVTSARDFVLDFSCVFVAPNIQRLHIRLSIHNYPSAQCDIDTDTINFNSLPWDLNLQCELTNAADNITFYAAHMKTVG